GTIGLNDAYMAYQPALRLCFSFDRDFKDTRFRDQVGFIGLLYLHTPEVDGEEIPVTVASSGCEVSSGWSLWTSNRASTQVGWDMVRGELNVDCQRPGPNPGGVSDVRSDSTIYFSNASHGNITAMAQSDDLVIPPDSAVQFDYAWLCAYPVNNPVPDNSNAGVALEAANLIKLSQMAYQLYETGYRLPKAPSAPNMKLIPGDRQVVITWDDLPIKTPDPFLPEDDPDQNFRRWDFEGFRVYRSRTGKVGDTELLAQYDLRNGITLETGVKDKVLHVFLEDGMEADMESPSAQDTLGASHYDKQKRLGLGSDTGIKFAYVDQWDEQATFQRLTNGFRYFYRVTAYDWNMGESLESPIVFTEKNMVVPRSDANTYRVADIELGVMYDGAGNELDPSADPVVPVEEGKLLGSAVPANAFANAEVIINDAGLISSDAEYRIRIDSIVGGPGPKKNHLLDPTFNANLWQTVYVSLLDGAGKVLCSDFDQMKMDVDAFADYAEYSDGHFLLSPMPDSGRGVPFSVEFDLLGFDFNFMHLNHPEIIQGLTSPADIKIKLDYGSGNNNLPAGFRAADFEIRFVDYGIDSVSLEVWDLTHNVNVPFMDYPGAGWCLYSSWSRFFRLMKDRFRGDLTYDDIYGGGPRLKRAFPKYSPGDFPLSRAAAVRIHLCGLQLAVSSKNPPVPGDKWLVRTNFGSLPDSAGNLTPMSPRPPVSGVSYGILISPARDSQDNLDLKKIRVVPNPFIIRTPWDQSPLSKEMQFINLPNRCKIKIYTLSGHLVQVLEHNGGSNAYTRNWDGGTLVWNLQNRFNSLIASGWYIWHATDLDTGKKEMGKFAVIQ
ncbi:MAG: hypothetical protein U9P14_02435, partial [Gemmatimonadota bacterium]|nr:hypothetical protein [Gemmatimonadota bacterium]